MKAEKVVISSISPFALALPFLLHISYTWTNLTIMKNNFWVVFRRKLEILNRKFKK